MNQSTIRTDESGIWVSIPVNIDEWMINNLKRIDARYRAGVFLAVKISWAASRDNSPMTDDEYKSSMETLAIELDVSEQQLANDILNIFKFLEIQE